MQLIINNISAGTLTYLSGAISITSGSSATVTNPVQQLSLSSDGQLRSDILLSNVTLGDGVNTTGASDAIIFLDAIAQRIGPISDSTGASVALGQTTMSASIPVTLASNQTALTVSLPTGSATAANQSTEITSLQLIDNMIGPVTPGTIATASALIGGEYSGTLPSLSNGQQAAIQVDATGRQLVVDILNIAGQYRAQSVTTSAAEALGGSTILANRKMLSITPTNGTVYWGFSNSVTTSTGTPIFKNQTVTFAVGSSVHVYVIAASTIDCRMAEGS